MIESSLLRSSVAQVVQNTFEMNKSERYLQGGNSTYGDKNNANDGTTDGYEFVAFLLWYIFLVLCCVVPTCCAYHRRRSMEQQLSLHRNTMRQNSNSLFFLSTLQQQNALRPRNSELVQQERLGILREELKGTTMTIEAEHIVIPQLQNGEAPTAAAVIVDLENSDGTDDCRQIIQLPAIGINTDRTIAGVCTICLCPYEDGDQITWSTEKQCQHAFHTDCIIPWLAKKEEPKCPICRQEFCAAPNVSQVDEAAFDIDLERENSFLHSFSQALAMSQLYRPYAAESPNNYEHARNAFTLQLATLALENQVRLEQEQQTAAATATVHTPNGDSNIRITLDSDLTRHDSSRVVGDGNDTDIATASSSSAAENPRSMTDLSNDNTIPSDTAIAPAP